MCPLQQLEPEAAFHKVCGALASDVLFQANDDLVRDFEVLNTAPNNMLRIFVAHIFEKLFTFFADNSAPLSMAFGKYSTAKHEYFFSTDFEQHFATLCNSNGISLRRPNMMRSTLWEAACTVFDEQSQVTALASPSPLPLSEIQWLQTSGNSLFTLKKRLMNKSHLLSYAKQIGLIQRLTLKKKDMSDTEFVTHHSIPNKHNFLYPCRQLHPLCKQLYNTIEERIDLDSDKGSTNEWHYAEMLSDTLDLLTDTTEEGEFFKMWLAACRAVCSSDTDDEEEGNDFSSLCATVSPDEAPTNQSSENVESAEIPAEFTQCFDRFVTSVFYSVVGKIVYERFGSLMSQL